MKNIKEFIVEQLITEHFMTLTDNNIGEMKKWSKQAWEIIEKAYSYLPGGLAGCKNYDDFCKEYVDNANSDKLMWKCVKRGEKLSAIRIYTLKRGGRKSIVCAGRDDEQGKADITKILQEDYHLKDRNMWAEVSGKALGAALKNGATVLPNYVVKTLMKDKDAKGEIKLLEDGWFYLRRIAGDWHAKVIIGNAPDGEPQQLTEEEQKQIKELGKSYEEKYKKQVD